MLWVRLFALLLAFVLAGALAAPAWAQASSKKSSGTKKKKSASRKPAAQKGNGQQRARRAARLQATFVESSDLQPMAEQLLETRSQAAYDGIEAYARKHDDSAGSLAWLVVGYAYLQDGLYDKSAEALTRAQKHAGELRDYVDYFLAQAQQAAGKQADAAATLDDFHVKYPASLLHADAALVRANALIATGKPAAAAAVLERHRSSPRAELEFALGRAYAKAGNNAGAAQALRNVYYHMPTSAFAESAYAELQVVSGLEVPTATYEQRRRRAELLAEARQYSQAAEEYRELLPHAPSSELRRLQVAYGVALYKARQFKDARLVLEQVADGADELTAQRLFYLSELYKDDGKQWVRLVNRMRDDLPTSPWLSEALLAAGNRALLKRDYPTAINFYREVWTRNPQGKWASYTHWKTAWLSYRIGRRNEAKKLFEEQVSDYAGGLETANALYWRARLAEEDGELAKAKAYYTKLTDRYRLFYYGEIGRERLAKLKYDGPPSNEPVLARISAPASPGSFITAPPRDNVRLQKALVLRNGALYDFALRELQAAASAPGSSNWATAQIVKLYLSMGRHYRALQLLKRTVPGYYSYDFNQLPRMFWEVLFPRVYWTDLKKHALENNLDPFLVAALIRQESEFNPGAVSRANAMGLMQLLPSTAKKVARDVKLKDFHTAQLTVPSVNLQLGVTYFRQMLEKHDGRLEYALAAYNAGPHRVEDWRTEEFRDIPEFVESIPFTETREYVQAIVRNAAVYKRLYGEP